MIVWFLLGLLNVAAIALNVGVGVTYGFDLLTYFCIALNTSVAVWCFIRSATADY